MYTADILYQFFMAVLASFIFFTTVRETFLFDTIMSGTRRTSSHPNRASRRNALSTEGLFPLHLVLKLIAVCLNIPCSSEW